MGFFDFLKPKPQKLAPVKQTQSRKDDYNAIVWK